VVAVTVNGGLCAARSYPNKPCVAVTVCTPGTTSCQTISDILLDTGSSGLRVFRQALTVALPDVTVPSGRVAQCIQWGDGTSDWGPVQRAAVVLGSEPAVQVPIHVIDRSFGTAPTSCGRPEPDPVTAGFNGVLGVGLFVEDCGDGCVVDAQNGIYYSCTGSACTGIAVSRALQVQNPVAALPEDNNGVIVELPDVPVGGTVSLEGQLLLGIGTRSNNAAAWVTVLAVDDAGFFETSFQSASYPAFLDTGSDGLFFPPAATGLPGCPAPNSSWFCPTSGIALSATNSGSVGTGSSTVSFRIADFLAFAGSSFNVSAEIGGPATPQNGFDWGLPFHFGRRVVVGLEGRSSTPGVGPYFAY
jgi:hypothetical protein